MIGSKTQNPGGVVIEYDLFTSKKKKKRFIYVELIMIDMEIGERYKL